MSSFLFLPSMLLLLLLPITLATPSPPLPPSDPSAPSATSPNATDTQPGRAALADARSAVESVTIEDEDGQRHTMSSRPAADFAHVPGHNVTLTPANTPTPPPKTCGPACEELADQIVTAVEGVACRTLLVTGKCPGACMSAISTVMGADNWADCEAACVSDVVTSGAKRWAKMCASRQETLIDQGKEAVKSLVADGLAARMQRKLVAQFIVGALIIVLGLAYAYRRRLVTARIAYRLQKRCLMGRKNSDLNLPV